MRELIDRQETLDALDERFESLLRRFDYDSYKNADDKTKLVCDGLYEAEDVVMGMDTANPRKGKWIHVSEEMWKCDQCGEISCCSPNFCPDCGSYNG